jgi:chromosome segregation ATPase
VTEKSNTTANGQIEALTDLVTSLLRAMEEQKQAHANQIESLTQQIEALKVEVTEMTEKIQTQISNIQMPHSAAPSYADVARTPPSSQPSNLTSLSSMNTMPSTVTDTLY